MNILLIILIVIMLAGMLLIGFLAATKQKSAADFLIGGRRFGLLSSTATQIASAFGGGVMLAQVGIGYRYGFSVLIYSSIAAPLGVFLLAKFFARWLRNQDFYTTTDWMCQQYGETKTLRSVTSIVVSLYAIAAWVAQPIAAGKILNVLTGLPVEWAIFISAAVVIVYTMSGGIIAVAYTDVAQLGLMLIAIFVLLPTLVIEAGGLANIAASVPPQNLTLTAVGNDVWIGWLLAIIPAQIVKQTYHQRIFASKNANIAAYSLYTMATVSCVMGFWAAAIGMAIYTINPDIIDQELATIWAVQNLLHPVISAIALAGLIAAVISTADSALHSAASCLTRDIYQQVFNINASDKDILRVSKIFVLLIGIAGIAIGMAAPQVLAAILLGYSLTAAGLFFPLVLGRYWRKANRASAISGLTAGVMITMAARLGIIPTGPLPEVAVGLLGSLSAMLFVIWITHTYFHSKSSSN